MAMPEPAIGLLFAPALLALRRRRFPSAAAAAIRIG